MKFSTLISYLTMLIPLILTSKPTLALPLSIYDLLVSDATFLSDIGEYYFGENDGSDGTQLKRVVRHENSFRNGVQDKCMLPTKKGYCRALIPRFGYDPSKGTCVEFKFGGCDGNANNFLSFSQCMDSCGRAKRRSS